MKREITTLVSDISGVELKPLMSKTILFSLQGVDYSIDLTNEEAIEFEVMLHPYVQAAREVGGRRKVARRKLSSG